MQSSRSDVRRARTRKDWGSRGRGEGVGRVLMRFRSPETDGKCRAFVARLSGHGT